ncbi:hypothetical protein [Embleya sp. NPDC001921]
MSEDTAPARRVIGVEKHAWTPELRRALLGWGGDATDEQGRVKLAHLNAERILNLEAARTSHHV